MKRKGIKIASLILTIISISIILFSYLTTALIFDGINNMPESEGPNGAALLLVFILIGIIMISLVSFELSGACIIMNSIDLHKTKNEGKSIKIPLTFLIINIIIVVLGIAYFPLLEVFGG